MREPGKLRTPRKRPHHAPASSQHRMMIDVRGNGKPLAVGSSSQICNHRDLQRYAIAGQPNPPREQPHLSNIAANQPSESRRRIFIPAYSARATCATRERQSEPTTKIIWSCQATCRPISLTLRACGLRDKQSARPWWIPDERERITGLG